MPPWKQYGSYQRDVGPTPMERFICVLCYFTFGIAGIIYIIIKKSSNQGSFFRFHFLQAIVLGILSWLLNYAFQALGLMMQPVGPALGEMLGKVMAAETADKIVYGVVFLLQNIYFAWGLLPIYGAIMAGLGKLAEIPFISNLVRQQMR